MNLRLAEVNEDNFFHVINLKSDEVQEKYFQIYERWVGSNAFFLAMCHTHGYTPRAIYDGDILIGFASHGFSKGLSQYELISMMIGHQFQGKGYGTPALQAIIDDMVQAYQCDSIYLTVIEDNERAIRVYEKLGFRPTGEVEQGHHPEPIYCLALTPAAAG